ncbi:hypothetical protein XA68_13584 [Ophiocordyceps unilateralis]|uniref:Cytochrome P450 n=1 Tax=Ophiocordyceps unilateralis TaxID=268505 RepID=A0A2A9PCB8_OPHUN|nr:hypothetical protein XA68_13584 [Ophiocordyceps unilateralis]
MATVIDDLRSPLLRGSVFLGGVIVHVALLRHGEWHVQAPRLVGSVMALSMAMPCAIIWLAPELLSAPWPVLMATTWLVSAGLAGLYSSALVYRAALHPLNRFPGPFAARLSNLYMTTMDAKKSQIYREVRKLHEAYGDIVRVGPSELSIRDPKAIRLIHASSSSCVRGIWYDMLHPERSLHALRNKKEHGRRRKAWDRAFSNQALRDYEPRVVRCTSQLVSLIDEMQGQPVDASRLFTLYSFDVTGEIGFGKSFNILTDGVLPEAISLASDLMHRMSVFRRLVWQVRVLNVIPALNRAQHQLNHWLCGQIAAREQRASDQPDVFSHILVDHEAKGQATKPTVNLLGDLTLLVVAGRQDRDSSDTISAALACLFFELAVHPDARRTLQAELDRFHETEDATDNAALSRLEYLGACIDEALRIYPPALSGLQMKTSCQGLHLGDVFIPGDTIVQIPQYALSRDERCFVHADCFIPERWTTKPDLMTDGGSASFPFSYGPYSCVGSALAKMELRYVTAQILGRFDLELAPGFSASSFEDGLKDHFTMEAPSLNLVFRSRRPDGLTVDS